MSDKGRFDKTTNDCFFEANVRATENPGEIVISADNLNLLSTSNTAEIFNNVNLFNGEGSFLKADRVEYDLKDELVRKSIMNTEEKVEENSQKLDKIDEKLYEIIKK